MPAEETGKHNFIRDKRVTNFAELWTSLWILGCTGNSLIEVIKDVCACGHVVRMVPSLIILCLGCSLILPIIIFSCHRSNERSLNIKSTRLGILSLLYLFYYLFFSLFTNLKTPCYLWGNFFFQRPFSPQKFTMTPLTSRPLHQSKPFVLAPKLKSTNQNPDLKTAQSELAQKTPLLLITNTAYNAFFLLYLVTQEEEIFGRVNEGVRVSLAFFCLITSFDILRRITHSK